ncbi:MAG: DNA polymerase IV [Erysipelotrichia bacterium]|nr:DNA polymerase IV [Erysipelotrichia bacterium]
MYYFTRIEMIIHLDLDCFFVSAERTRSAFLKNKPVVVCKSGDTKIFSHEDMPSMITESVGGFNGLMQHKKAFHGFDKNEWKKEFVDDKGRVHGIVIAKSYEAKKYGIKTGTLLKDALLMCPNLLVLPSDHLFYQLLSAKLKSFLQTKIPILEQYSIDEFWGDLCGWIKDEDTYTFMANLQKEVLETFDLPCSIGASTSKWIAKLATDFNKPYGLTLVPKDNITAFVSPLPIATFPGIGKALQKRCENYKIRTLGELIQSRRLIEGWGTIGKQLIARVTGKDNELVAQNKDRKSIGISRNFALVHDREEVLRRAIILSRHLSHTIAKLHLHPTTYYFKIRYDGGIKSQSSQTIDRLFSESFYRDLTQKTIDSLDIYPHLGIHHLSLHVSNFTTPSQSKTFSLLHQHEDNKAVRLNEKITKLRDKYGVDIVRAAIEKTPKQL